MKLLRLGVLVLGAAVLGACKFPAFEGSDICSGLRVGDLLEISIGPAVDKSGVSVECDTALGFGEGGQVKGSVLEVGPDGCGSAIGPIVSLDGLFSASYDAESSRSYSDGRTDTWVSSGQATSAECSGDLTVRLQALEPAPLAERATSELLVRYFPGSGALTCPATCGVVHQVTVARAK